MDLGSDGACVETQAPAPVGSALTLEIYPQGGMALGAPLFLEGVVVYVRDGQGNRHLMGIHFDVAFRGEAATWIYVDDHRDADGTVPIAKTSLADDDVADGPGYSARDQRRLIAAILMVLALLLVYWLVPDGARRTTHGPLSVSQGMDGSASEASGINAALDHALNIPMASPRLPLMPLTGGNHPWADDLAKTDFDVAVAPPMEFLDRAQAALVAGRLEEAAATFAMAADHPRASNASKFQAQLGRAQALAAAVDWTDPTDLSNSASEAQAIVANLLATGGGVAQPWREAAARLAEALAGGGTGLSGESMSEGMGLRDATAADGPISTGDYSIDVDKGDYVLTLLRDGEPVKEYPVGLGLANSTPEGIFQVANRIANPDWYNRGRSVPAGDPENPLGASWMGLGQGGFTTSYGIHPTEEASSIGQDASGGCIRMRPDDAAEVFAACDVGTVVRIRP
jgi:hypothetical protein